MKVADFNYELPEELIAQSPIKDRATSRLLVLDRQSGEMSHRHFYDILDYVQPGDCLVLNDSRVIPARLRGWKEDTQAAMEFLLLKQRQEDQWEVLVRPGRRAKPGTRFVFGDGLLRAEVLEVVPGGNRIVQFFYEGNNFFALLDQIGQMPLPPYIHEQLNDPERYQTVYAKNKGSAAAPTAGLHFTRELLAALEQKGVALAYVTLHVGLGTFRPVKVADVDDHIMHAEYYTVSEQSAKLINQAKESGHRVICVGTTSCRTVESVMRDQGQMCACSGWTDIFIYPGYQFKIMDGLITNFHLPESTLVMLVSAFAGREHVLNAYQQAIKERYYFFSFGDAMLII